MAPRPSSVAFSAPTHLTVRNERSLRWVIRTGRSVKVKRVDCSLVGVEIVTCEEHGYQQDDAFVLEHLDEVAQLFAHCRGGLYFDEGAIGAYDRVRR